MLRLSGVGRRFPNGLVALDGIELTIRTGETLVLLGPSGCGKSTLLRLIAGLDEPDPGRIAWDAARPGPGEIGFVFQDPTLMPWADALRNASLPLRLRHDPDAHAKASAALARVGLAGFEHSRPAQLSGGMRMRVSLARALAARPRLMLMDEPFAALDEITRHRLQDEFAALAAELHVTVVLVTHSLYEAATLADRVAVMTPRPGRIARTLDFAGVGRLDRLSPDYAARVATLGDAMRALHIDA